jgi:hypothetical protein
LNKILKEKDMPSVSTVYRWLRNDSEFADGYSQARQIQADTLADATLEIADDCGNTAGEVGKARLQVNARQWYAGCVRPKAWGPSSGLGVDGSQIVVTISRIGAGEDEGPALLPEGKDASRS